MAGGGPWRAYSLVPTHTAIAPQSPRYRGKTADGRGLENTKMLGRSLTHRLKNLESRLQPEEIIAVVQYVDIDGNVVDQVKIPLGGPAAARSRRRIPALLERPSSAGVPTAKLNAGTGGAPPVETATDYVISVNYKSGGGRMCR